MNKTKILFYDIEIAPLIGTSWRTYDTSLIWTIQEWYMLCFAYMWEGDKRATVVSQTDFKDYKPGSPDDLEVVKKLHELMSEADIVIAHNGDSFDQRKAQSRFAFHKLGPPVPYQQVDTLKMARKYFGFTSNRLDDLGEYLGLGRKLKTDKDLWRDCMAGIDKAWKQMKSYNKQDVVLLEKVYRALLPWSTNHPNRANIAGRPEVCPNCEATGPFQSSGWRHTKTGKYRRFQCMSCSTYISERSKFKGDTPEHV